jgi:hypothetical protein
MLMTLLILVLNTGISYWNARNVGRAWNEAQAAGGSLRFMTWMGAIMAACGFSFVLLFLLAFGGIALGYLPPEAMALAFDFGYLALVFPMLGSGFAITATSLARAWRERTLRSAGLAGWNTIAQVYNTSRALKGVPAAFGRVKEALGKRNGRDNPMVVLAVLVAVAAVAGGVLLTMWIVRHEADKAAGDMRARFAGAAL